MGKRTSGTNDPQGSTKNRTIDHLFNYLNMAGAEKASEFQPLTQEQRAHIYLKTMINPLGHMKAGFSAGIDQSKDRPEEWEQGASGYGKRFANILGQYSIQRVTFCVASRLARRQSLFQFRQALLAPHEIRPGQRYIGAAR